MRPYYQDEFCRCGCAQRPSPGRGFISGHNLKGLHRTAQHRANIGEAQKKAWATKRQRKPLGSKRKDTHGYVLVKMAEGNGRWPKEHICHVEAAINRRLSKSEQIHHINGIRDDNRLENLFLCRDGSHHHRIEGTFSKCLAELLRRGVVVFDRGREEYRLA
jgi:hypothetical protein